MRSRAAILYEYGWPWSVQEFELDPPRAGVVLVRLAASGLCHSDEHIRQGRLAPPPDTLRALGLPAMSPTIGGHEGSGVVVEVGDGVSGHAPVFGSCNPRSDIPLLAAMYASGQLLLDEMITRRYPLDGINDAYADLAAGRLIRGVIDFGLG
jgi:Zn-dependent alcohol dehydrogenase